MSKVLRHNFALLHFYIAVQVESCADGSINSPFGGKTMNAIQKPQAIVRMTFKAAPGADWLALQERWSVEEVDVAVDLRTYDRLKARGLCA